MRKFYFALMVVALAAVAAAGPEPVRVAADHNPSASGHGNVLVGPSASLRTFSFSAIQHKDGTVTGQATLKNRTTGNRFHWEIDCLRIDGNVAYLSGIVTESTVPGLVGQPAIFKVEDNGEGEGDPPDKITNVFHRLAIPCTEEYPEFVVLYEILAGNIQVRP